MKVLAVLGTRPEVIKLAPVIRALKKIEGIEVAVCATGQHAGMFYQMLAELDLPADHEFIVLQEGQPLAALTARLLANLEVTLREVGPDLVLVQGDTTTAMAGALAAFYRHIHVGHVEAGLRTYKDEPFPEEANRQIIARIAQLHFAPTQEAVNNLIKERVPLEQIYLTGNPVVDALDWALAQPTSHEWASPKHLNKRLVLVTCHRREAWGRRLEVIARKIMELARDRQDLFVLWPLHANPDIKETISRIARDTTLFRGNLEITDHIGYTAMAHLINMAALVITDSGGMLEEAVTLGKPVLIIREVTERPEAYRYGARLVREHMLDALPMIAWFTLGTHKYTGRSDVFGDGHAGERIAEIVARNL